MDFDIIKSKIVSVAEKYQVKSILLFGSRAEGTYKEDSDFDLIVEFFHSVSLLTLAELKFDLEDIFGKKVDLIHGPVREDDMIEVGRTVELYAA